MCRNDKNLLEDPLGNLYFSSLLTSRIVTWKQQGMTLMAVGGSKGRKADGMKGWRREEKQFLKTNRIKVKVGWRLLCLEPGKVNCDLTGPVLYLRKNGSGR